MIVVIATLVGIVAGLRAMTAPAAMSWAAYFGWLPLQNTYLSFLGFAATPYLLTALAIAELISDQLPKTPSRKTPIQFGSRLVTGGLCGAAVGMSGGVMIAGIVAGLAGATIGTFAGASARTWLAKALGRDLPAALVEDVVAVGGVTLIVAALT